MAVTVKSWGWRRPHRLVYSTSGNYPTRPQRLKSSPSACLLAKSPISSHWREKTRWVQNMDGHGGFVRTTIIHTGVGCRQHFLFLEESDHILLNFFVLICEGASVSWHLTVSHKALRIHSCYLELHLKHAQSSIQKPVVCLLRTLDSCQAWLLCSPHSTYVAFIDQQLPHGSV